MARTIAIDASGRLVVPKDVRERHHLRAGVRLVLTERGNELVFTALDASPQTKEEGGVLVFAGRLAVDAPDHRELREARLARLAE